MPTTDELLEAHLLRIGELARSDGALLYPCATMTRVEQAVAAALAVLAARHTPETPA